MNFSELTIISRWSVLRTCGLSLVSSPLSRLVPVFPRYIVRKIDYQVVCVVELDDSIHDRPDRVKRDLKVNTALENAGIFILRSRSSDFLIDAIKSRFF
ncbi:TPA: DUF2726 domain-containing protein [Salmonella enterica subsp. enterica serovar Bovismorbificans]